MEYWLAELSVYAHIKKLQVDASRLNSRIVHVEGITSTTIFPLPGIVMSYLDTTLLFDMRQLYTDDSIGWEKSHRLDIIRDVALALKQVCTPHAFGGGIVHIM